MDLQKYVNRVELIFQRRRRIKIRASWQSPLKFKVNRGGRSNIYRFRDRKAMLYPLVSSTGKVSSISPGRDVTTAAAITHPRVITGCLSHPFPPSLHRFPLHPASTPRRSTGTGSRLVASRPFTPAAGIGRVSPVPGTHLVNNRNNISSRLRDPYIADIGVC